MKPLDLPRLAVNAAARHLVAAMACVLVAACSSAPLVPEPSPVPADSAPAVSIPPPEVTTPVPTPSVTVPAPAEVTPPAAIEPAALQLAAVGDIMLGGSAAPELRREGYDYPFALVQPILDQADVVFGNLEGPLTDAGQAAPDKRYVFRSPAAKAAPALAAAGFTVMSLANNHTMDYGVDGLKQTIAALDEVGIRHAGAGMNLQQARQAAFLNSGDYTLGFLAYSLTFPESFWAQDQRPGTAFGHADHIRADVAATREQADVVVVSFHWGREATTELRDYQSILAHAAIDSGATVVLGHHPHILQGIEHYKDGIIFYSLGNFVFGSYSRKATRSIIALLNLQGAKVSEVRLIPVNVDNIELVFQPRLLVGEQANEVIAELKRLSKPLSTAIMAVNGVGLVQLSGQTDQKLMSQQEY
ncbi:MAG: CapA family protein [Gammaproteobacteria bacterium]|nr:CapA family protein [Gammaproteobacteria bacterium]